MAEKMEDAVVPPGRFENNNATPTRERAVASYPARRGYKPYIQTPPKVHAVEGMIDIHCHAEHGQQDFDRGCQARVGKRHVRHSLQIDRQGRQAFCRTNGRCARPRAGTRPLVRRDRHCADQGLGRLRALPRRQAAEPRESGDAGQGRRVVVLAGIGQSRQHVLCRWRKGPALGSDGRSQGALGTAPLGFGAEVWTLRH